MEYSIILGKVEGQPASDLLALESDSCTYMLMDLDLGASTDQMMKNHPGSTKAPSSSPARMMGLGP